MLACHCASIALVDTVLKILMRHGRLLEVMTPRRRRCRHSNIWTGRTARPQRSHVLPSLCSRRCYDRAHFRLKIEAKLQGEEYLSGISLRVDYSPVMSWPAGTSSLWRLSISLVMRG